MSICPENDIHSVYLDGELNSPYKEQYLEHLQTCSSCSEKLQKLKNLQTILKEDSESITLSEKQLEDSYEKLSTLLKFRNVTKKSTVSPWSTVMKAVPAMAAALIIAVVLPIRLSNTTPTSQDMSFISQANSVPKLFTERGVLADESVSNSTTPILVSNPQNEVFNIDNIFMPRTHNKYRNLNFVVNTLPNNNSTSTFNMYNNGQSMYNVTYTPMAGFED
ncbi:MAG: hypothetical protein II232_07105 [Spirochaetaceae bacterium]|nr:hypothetical protein [Spirochaetaceae bacterium]